MKINTIIFDLDDTLIVEEPLAIQAFITVAKEIPSEHGIDPQRFAQTARLSAKHFWYNHCPERKYCVDIGISSWEGLWGSFEVDNPQMNTLREWSPQYRLNTWTKALAEHDIKDTALAERMSQTYRTLMRARNTIFQDTIPVLTELSKKYTLAMVTNGAADIQNHKIEKSHLAKYFNSIIISGVFGIRKPNPEPFIEALNHLNAKPDEAIMIGNSLDSDIEGAQATDIKAVWLNRDNQKNDTDITPNFEITDLYQLKTIIE